MGVLPRGCAVKASNVYLLLLLLTLTAAVRASATSSPCPAFLKAMPALMTLHAPYTPFRRDDAKSLNATAANIDKLAANAASKGVTTIFVPGSMSQFETMSLTERKVLMTNWVSSGHKHNLFVILHVGTTVQSDAIELAQYAGQLGADGIGSVPMYYETSSDIPTIVDFLKPIAAAAPSLPFFYYHLPGVTHANILVSELLESAEANMPTLCGVKWVGTSLADWFKMVSKYNTTRALLFAPEPKLASFSLGMGRGVVLAEDFYAPTYLRMRSAWMRGDAAGANEEQAWKYASEAVFRSYQGNSKRRVYERFDLTQLDMGDGRLPQQPFDVNGMQAKLFSDLDKIDFWAKAEL
jgi:N-acetylneuraminate lyase